MFCDVLLDLRRHFNTGAIFAGKKFIGLGVMERLTWGVEGELPPEPKRDVPKVAQSGAEMPGLDVRSGGRTLFDAIEKILNIP